MILINQGGWWRCSEDQISFKAFEVEIWVYEMFSLWIYIAPHFMNFDENTIPLGQLRGMDYFGVCPNVAQ